MSNDIDQQVSAEEGAAEIFTLLGMLRRHSARVAGHCGPDGMPAGGWILMHQLRQSPGETVSGLARACGISKSRVSVLADDLHGRGLVEKRPDPEDQRVLRLFPTAYPDGRGANPFRDAMVELVADLSAAERQHLLQALRKMRAGAEHRGW